MIKTAFKSIDRGSPRAFSVVKTWLTISMACPDHLAEVVFVVGSSLLFLVRRHGFMLISIVKPSKTAQPVGTIAH